MYTVLVEGQHETGYWERVVIASMASLEIRPVVARSFSAFKGRTSDLMALPLLLVIRFPERRWACLTSLDAPNSTHLVVRKGRSNTPNAVQESERTDVKIIKMNMHMI